MSTRLDGRLIRLETGVAYAALTTEGMPSAIRTRTQIITQRYSRNVCQYISCVASTFHLSEEIGFLPDFENCVGTGGGTCQACERYLHRMVRITLATLCAYSMPS